MININQLIQKYIHTSAFLGLSLLMLSNGSATAQISRFAAIAYSRSNGVYGAAYNSPTLRNARELAKIECQYEGSQDNSDCEILVSGHDSCFALARNNSDQEKVGAAMANTEGSARTEAQQECDGECQVIYSNCM